MGKTITLLGGAALVALTLLSCAGDMLGLAGISGDKAKALTDAEIIADAMAYVADSVDASPPAEQRGLHPGPFTIDWGDAKVFRNGGLDVVNAPISATNHYSGVFPVSQADSALGDYATAIYQRLVLTLDRRYWRHGAFIATVIPDAAHATADEGAIAPTVYSGDPLTGFSGMMAYSLVGSNATVTVERFEDGLNIGRVSLFNPRSSRFEPSDICVGAMRSLAGKSRTGRGQLRPATRSGDDPPEPGGDSPNNDGILTDAGSDDGYGFGSGDNPVGLGDVVCTSPKPGGSGGGSTGDDGSFDTGQGDPGTGSPTTGPSPGAGGSGNPTVDKAGGGGADEFEDDFGEMLEDNCGFQQLFALIGEISLSDVIVDTSLGGEGSYNPVTNAITFRSAGFTKPIPTNGTAIAEIAHYAQDRLYPGGIAQYANIINTSDGSINKLTPGSTNIEFEAHLFADLYLLGQGVTNRDMYKALGGITKEEISDNDYWDFLESLEDGTCSMDKYNAMMWEYHDYTNQPGEIYPDMVPLLLEGYASEVTNNDCGSQDAPASIAGGGKIGGGKTTGTTAKQ